MSRGAIVFAFETDVDPEQRGDFQRVEVPGRYDVCGRCRGAGKHVNPSVDGHGITAEELDQAGPDFLDDYLGGAYDVTCHECGGERITLGPDLERCSPEQRAHVERFIARERRDRRERASEVRFGY